MQCSAFNVQVSHLICAVSKGNMKVALICTRVTRLISFPDCYVTDWKPHIIVNLNGSVFILGEFALLS